MMDDISAGRGAVEQLRDREFEPFLAACGGPLAVLFSTGWSPACRILRPIMAQLAIRFAGRVTVVALDGDEALQFRRRYAVEAVPQLLAFDRRRLSGRLSAPDDAAAVRGWFVAAFRLDATPCAAEDAFLAAFRRALRVHDELLGHARRAAAPHLDTAGRHMDAFERRLADSRRAGQVSDEAEMELRSAEFERIFAPFRAEMDALAAAEGAALAAYEDLMDEALDEFAAHRGQCGAAVASGGGGRRILP